MADVIEIDDLSELCSKDKQNEGIWFQVEVNRKPWDVEVLVYGRDSDVIQDYQRELTKSRIKTMRLDDETEVDDELAETVLNGTDELLLKSFGGIRKASNKQPLKFNGNEIPVTKDENCEHLYKAILEGSPDIADFVAKKTKERSNFLPERKKN